MKSTLKIAKYLRASHLVVLELTLVVYHLIDLTMNHTFLSSFDEMLIRFLF